ncbi:MAG: family 78 glycoside hydrolase catalytic domain [Alistipes sp.]|uniref:alpha-L-rhamnosidase n=1 Tax=Alistipes indistinctus TaxID=626932 RepID=UPI00241C4437|nr:alpha-L-rhamnosidase [Alistipes indistinctus]MBD9133783.1 alpha-L-rhamnosidase [Alistipes indistinctus]MBD9134402.1 alpha-L-rhamnosidase [Alistipes indistinctus]MBS1439908.1 family 78 glycoside hydrolase catalytic domain [Alistipes sp.]
MKKTLPVLLRTLPLLFLLYSAGVLQAQVFSVSELRCEQSQRPLAVDPAGPRLSWQLNADRRGCLQSAYRILVADSPVALADDNGNVWDSGKVFSDRSVLVPYGGPALQPGKAYCWKVQAWDADGNLSPWSLPASFGTGLMSMQDWNGAKWIAMEPDVDSLKCIEGNTGKWKDGGPVFDKPVAPYKLPQLRREFTATKPVKRAMAYICGLGQFEMFLNGEKVGDHFLDPAWTKFDKEAQYVAFDITGELRDGKNAVGVMLGNGYYHTPHGRYLKLLFSYGAPKMICKLQIEYADGTAQTVVSDDKWRASESPVTFSSIYGGEDYDASAVQPGWAEPGFDDRKWKKAVLTQGAGVKLIPQISEPLKVMERIPTVRRFRAANGNWVYDLGQNASGIVQLTVRAVTPQSIKLIPGELINDDSTVNQRASGAPFYHVYTARGDGSSETWHPQFTYYGFRYVEVEGAVPAGESNPGALPEVIDITGLHTRNSAAQVGTFACSDPLFNKIHTLIDWAVRSNMASVLTDCPHREKLGWLEVTHLMGGSIQYRYDISRLYAKQVNDMRTAQHANGMVPTIAPQYVTFSPDFIDTPEWGSAFVIIPWNLYEWYGDLAPLRDNYERMKRYVDYLGSRADNHIVAYGLGDWYDIGPDRPGYAQLTSNGVTATAIYYQDVKILERVARLLGKEADVRKYAALASDIKRAFNEKFFDKKTLKYDRDSQTANSIALHMDLVEPQYKAVVRQNLIDDIRRRGNALTAGDVGYRYVLRALEENDASEVIYDMNSRYDVPGYGYQLAHGATCLTESWQAYREVSNNHCMLGHLMEWLYSGLGGIRQSPGSAGYKEIVIRPQVVGDIHSAAVSFRSPYGLIRSEWSDSPQQYRQRVEIPANTTALVYLPAVDPAAVSESGVPLGEVPGLSVRERGKDYLAVAVGSGIYDFRVAR